MGLHVEKAFSILSVYYKLNAKQTVFWHGADQSVMSTQAVEIQVLGKILKVNCPLGQEDALQEAAADFDQRLKDLSARTNVTNTEQLLMFAGLNVCSDMHTERKKHNGSASSLSNRINLLTETLDKALQNQPKR